MAKAANGGTKKAVKQVAPIVTAPRITAPAPKVQAAPVPAVQQPVYTGAAAAQQAAEAVPGYVPYAAPAPYPAAQYMAPELAPKMPPPRPAYMPAPRYTPETGIQQELAGLPTSEQLGYQAYTGELVLPQWGYELGRWALDRMRTIFPNIPMSAEQYQADLMRRKAAAEALAPPKGEVKWEQYGIVSEVGKQEKWAPAVPTYEGGYGGYGGYGGGGGGGGGYGDGYTRLPSPFALGLVNWRIGG